MLKFLKTFPVLSAIVMIFIVQGAYLLYMTDHAIMLICIVYTAVLYGYFVKDLWND